MRRWRCGVMVALILSLAGCLPASPLVQPGETGPAPAATALPAATIVATLPVAPHQPGVTELLAERPAPQAQVEVDAYFSGAGAAAMRSGPPPAGNEVLCPTGQSWAAALTDQPFPPVLRLLSMTQSNALPEDGAWLVAAGPETIRPGVRSIPQLPYHARLRGYLGEPAFAHCPQAERIFVVEQVVQVYAEQAPEPTNGPFRLLGDYVSWPRYHLDSQGFGVAYPPGWQAQLLDDVTLALHSPDEPQRIVVRVHAGEAWYDQYDPAAAPSLLQGNNGMGVFEQGWAFGEAAPDSQRLSGYFVERAPAAGQRSVSVLLPANGRTYELAVQYPTGFQASQPLLTAFSAVVESFRLDRAPGPTPTPPVRLALGRGPFLTQEQALARAETQSNGPLHLLSAALVSEVAARQQADACNTFLGHPDGVWALVVSGQFEGTSRTMRLFLDATGGESLCGEEIAPAALTRTPAPGGAVASPLPTVTPAPAEIRPPLATLTISGKDQTSGIGTYCWNARTGPDTAQGLCVDRLGIPTAKEALNARSSFTAVLHLPLDAPQTLEMDVIPVGPGDRLEPAPPDASLWEAQAGKHYSLPLVREPSIDLTLDPGLYVLSVFAVWPDRGDVAYGFLVRVAEC